jgi:hypothetical protein
MKSTWIAVLLSGCALLASAQGTVTADWVDGKVERMIRSSWGAVEIGDVFGMDSTLRLAKGASAELSAGSVRVHLTASGTYRLTEAFDKARGRAGVSETVAKTMKMAGKNEFDLSTSSAAGVRGEAMDSASVSWAEEEDSSDPYVPVRALYDAGQFEEASARARKLRLSDSPSAPFRSAYWDAASLFARGLAVPAQQILEQAAPDSQAPEFKDASLLAARISMELADWSRALSFLEKYAPAGAPTGDRQLTLLLESVCYDSLGRKADVRKMLEAARKLDPDSLLGQEAAARLGQ